MLCILLKFSWTLENGYSRAIQELILKIKEILIAVIFKQILLALKTVLVKLVLNVLW